LKASRVARKNRQGAAVPFNNFSHSWLGVVGLTVAIGIAYFLAARLGMALRAQVGISVFWPAVGVAAGALIALGPNARMPVAVGVALALIASSLMIGRNPWLTLSFVVISVGQVLLTAWLIERWFGRVFNLDDASQVLGFLTASTLAAVIGAVGAAMALSFAEPTAFPPHVWRIWFASCLIGMVTVAPLLIGLCAAVRELPTRRELIEGGVGLVALAALSVFVISLPKGPWATALPVALVFPILLWVVVRCRPMFAAAATFIVSLAVIWSTTFDMGHFGDGSVPLEDRILAAQTLVLVGALLTLVLAALFAERRLTEQRLQKSERESRELLGGLPAAIYVTDAAGRVTYCNQSAVDLWGVKPKLREDRWCDLARYYHADGTSMALEDCPTEIALKQGRLVRGREAIIERLDGIRIPIVPYPTPLRDGRGTIVGVVNMTVDISERKKAELALTERNAQLALAGRAALVGTYTYDVNKRTMQISEGYAAIHGLPEGTTETSYIEWRARVHREDLRRAEGLRNQAFAYRRKEDNAEYRIVLSTGEIRWIERRGTVSYDQDGSPKRVVGVNIDVTERKRAEQHLRAMNAELDHRVKNVLAMVSALIGQTEEASRSPMDFVAALNHRIKSLAGTHELLSRSHWRGVPLADIIQRELAPYDTTNTDIGGPGVTLKAEATQAVATVLHELTTNAAKYGAFSNRAGQVSVQWQWLKNGSHDRLIIEWQEIGGPPVVAPSQTGYGTSIIRDLIPFELGGVVELVFASKGIRCRLEIPANWISRDGQLAGEPRECGPTQPSPNLP
jgi:PAS domain S-box-containing protein